MTYYDVLGVAPDAPTGEIRAAFVALARRHHPDYYVAASADARRHAEQRMRAINEAWAALSDPARRATYDRDHGLVPDPGAFRPLEPDAPGDADLRDEPDTPYRAVAAKEEQRRRVATLVPIGLFGASVGLFAIGLVLAVPAILALGVVLLLLSCAGFVVIPLVVLSRATRDEG